MYEITTITRERYEHVSIMQILPYQSIVQILPYQSYNTNIALPVVFLSQSFALLVLPHQYTDQGDDKG